MMGQWVTYKNLTLEFLNSLHTDFAGEIIKSGLIKFHLDWQDYSWNLATFEEVFRLS